MSENITHLAVFDDGARLALHSPHVCEAFKETLKKYWAIGRLGSVTRSGDLSFVRLANLARSNWNTRQPEDQIEEHLAYMLGWHCHLASDRSFKPGFRKLGAEYFLFDQNDGQECSIYHDVTIFREVYKDGEEDPFKVSSLDYSLVEHPAGQALPSVLLQDLLGAQSQSQWIELQSFLSDDSDFDAWLDLVFERLEPLNIDLNKYAEAYHNTDPGKLNRYIIQPNFYDRGDALIQLARGIQDDQVPSIDIDAALSAADSGSQYAGALKLAHEFLAAASDYFEDKIDEATLIKRCRIGERHVPLDQEILPLPSVTELEAAKW